MAGLPVRRCFAPMHDGRRRGFRFSASQKKKQGLFCLFVVIVCDDVLLRLAKAVDQDLIVGLLLV